MNLTAFFTTVGVSLLPIIEMRGGIPIGYSMGLTLWQAMFAGVLGNWAAMVVIALALPIVVEFAAAHIKVLHDFLLKLFAKTRKAHSKKIQRLEVVGLFAIVAIPLPGTGAWTGVLLAYLFGIPRGRAIAAMTAGLLTSALLIGGITKGFDALF